MKTIAPGWQPPSLPVPKPEPQEDTSFGNTTMAAAAETLAALAAHPPDNMPTEGHGSARPTTNPDPDAPGHPDSPRLIWVDISHREDLSELHQTENLSGHLHPHCPSERSDSPRPSGDALRLHARLKRDLEDMYYKASPASSSSGCAAAGPASAATDSDSDYQPEASPPPPTRPRKHAPPYTALPSEQSGSTHGLSLLADLPTHTWTRRGKAISPAFKRAILQKVHETGCQNAVAREAGINERTLRRWIEAERNISEDLFPRTHEKRSARAHSRPAMPRQKAAPVEEQKVEEPAPPAPARHKSGTSRQRIR